MRWVKFSVVGMVGVAIQLSALWLFAHGLGIPAMVSTVMAVEAALLHNFAWYEIWVFRDEEAA